MNLPLEFLLEALELKDERRTGWQLRGVADPESVAGHSWSVALLCLLFADECDEPIDPDRAVAMAVVHDLAEARTGDVATRAEDGAQRISAEEKERRERAAMAEFAASLPERAVDLWEEYEARETPTARFVKDMDLVDTCLQALAYERGGRYDPDEDAPAFEEYDALDEFFATAESRLSTDVGRRAFGAIREEYEAARRARR